MGTPCAPRELRKVSGTHTPSPPSGESNAEIGYSKDVATKATLLLIQNGPLIPGETRRSDGIEKLSPRKVGRMNTTKEVSDVTDRHHLNGRDVGAGPLRRGGSGGYRDP